jgi:hypothetical protein
LSTSVSAHLLKRGVTVQSNRGELISGGGEGSHASFTVKNEGVVNEWVAHEHFNCVGAVARSHCSTWSR